MRLAPLLRACVLERTGCPGDALALSMCVLVGAAVGLHMERDLKALLPLQCEDGGWEASWVYRLPTSDAAKGRAADKGKQHHASTGSCALTPVVVITVLPQVAATVSP